MQLDQVNVYPISLPFSDEFSHSLRKRFSANNIIVEILAENKTIRGYGEGAPRSYVTGESQASAIDAVYRFTRQDNFPWKLNTVTQIWDFVDRLSGGKAYNAAICAVETALLDALGKSENKSVIEYFHKDFYTDTVYYRATFPLTNKKRILEICRLCKKLKINKLRIKVGKDYIQNKETLEAVSAVFGDDYDLRADINGSWNPEIAANHIPLFNKYRVKILEQPLRPGDPYLAEFAELMQSHGVILMADESACSLRDVKRVFREGHYKMINVRLSKCGGFRNSFKIIDYLRQKGIRFQIGCHLGESGILSAAGRVLCLLCRDAAYCDGSYDEFILKQNVTTEDVSFGPEGKAGPLGGPGLGVEVNLQSLVRLSRNGTPLKISKP
ncbi:MAG: hypothetical protein KKH68_13070 [Proteobacteria bacterium]|nr:hypothetical protein [Pseudomonadota bacterium]